MSLGNFDATPPDLEPRFTIDLTSGDQVIRVAIKGKWPNVLKTTLATATTERAMAVMRQLIYEEARTPQPGAEPIDEAKTAELQQALDAAKTAAESVNGDADKDEKDRLAKELLQAQMQVNEHLGPFDWNRFIGWYWDTEADDALLIKAIDAICKELTGHPLERYAPHVDSWLADAPGGPVTSEPPIG